MATRVRVNPHDPRVKRTRQLLKQALSDLLAEKPFQDITVQDIADRATVNRVTFYAHFEDKYDLISAWIRDGFVKQLEAALPLNSSLSAEHLRMLCSVVLASLREAHRQCRAADAQYGPLFESAVQEALCDFILEWLRQWPREESMQGMTIESVAAMMSWTIFGAGIDWSRSGQVRSLDDVADEIVQGVLHGVSTIFQ
jgi:AcrR family transcriptional regulator